MKTLLSLGLTIALLAGCASNRAAKVDPAKINWSERVGSYSYAEAVAALGKPAVRSESDSGSTAEWVLKRSPRLSFGLGVGSFGPHTGVGVGTQVPVPRHGENLRLEFDRDGTLKSWARVKY